MLIAPPRRPKDKHQTKGTVRQTRVVVGDVACVVAVTTTLVVALELLGSKGRSGRIKRGVEMIVDVVVFMVAAVFVAVVLTDGCLRRPCRIFHHQTFPSLKSSKA